MDSKIDKDKLKSIKINYEKENSLNKKKVLIVDDDMRNVFALTSILEDKGITVVVGRNGEDGIEKLQENPDIVLMDVMMPKMDGLTAIRVIRNNEKYSKIPIIAITAKAMKEDREKCIEAGANDYLTKPIDTDKLISLLRVWLYK
ncbi:Polar-differentiation response regulator DivK [bioreactor metagenome]|uniref:Polar-differentiation response regulator DivK n=1 Tax=bioreactor metagenome TaxID=1076179 RepID=A0A645DJ68_9ZZZZ